MFARTYNTHTHTLKLKHSPLRKLTGKFPPRETNRLPDAKSVAGTILWCAHTKEKKRKRDLATRLTKRATELSAPRRALRNSHSRNSAQTSSPGESVNRLVSGRERERESENERYRGEPYRKRKDEEEVEFALSSFPGFIFRARAASGETPCWNFARTSFFRQCRSWPRRSRKELVNEKTCVLYSPPSYPLLQEEETGM